MLSVMHHLNPKKSGQGLRSDNYLCAGQTLLCKSLGLKVKVWDQQQMDPKKFRFVDVGYRPKRIIQTTRLGIRKGRDEHLMLRFVDYDYAAYCTSNPLKKRKHQEGREYKILTVK